jgi:hypothetical protein
MDDSRKKTEYCHVSVLCHFVPLFGALRFPRMPHGAKSRLELVAKCFVWKVNL